MRILSLAWPSRHSLPTVSSSVTPLAEKLNRISITEDTPRIAELCGISDHTPEALSKVRSRVESALSVADRQAAARVADGVETVDIGMKKLYHQTSIDGASSILKSQYFRPSPPASWFGAGALAKLQLRGCSFEPAALSPIPFVSLSPQASILPTHQRRPRARRSTPARCSRSRCISGARS